MALPLPHLDDRRWADLVDEGRALIPRHAPAWTDHNVHDPGVTLVELFAWLTEQGIYRLNLVSDRHRRKFLRLVGFDPRPAQSAEAAFAFRLESGVAPFAVPAGAILEVTRPDREPAVFRTRRAVSVDATTLSAVLVDTGDGVLRDATSDLRDGHDVRAFGSGVAVGASVYLGFASVPLATPVSLAVTIAGPESGRAERARLRHEAAARAAECHPPSEPCPDAEPSTPDPPPLLRHHSVRLAWACSSGGGWLPLAGVVGEEPPEPGEVRDDSRALTLDGLVELSLPSSAQPIVLGPIATPRVYVRARLASGAWDAPPVIASILVNGVWAEQAAPFAQSYPIAPGVVPPVPPLADTTTGLGFTLGPGAVITELTVAPSPAPPIRVHDYEAAGVDPGRLDMDLVLLGIGSGQPGQELMLPAVPTDAGRVRVFTHDGAAWESWIGRDDFDASTRADRHVVIDGAIGRVRGGNGERGRAFPLGVPVFAQGEATLGGGGNAAAGSAVGAADHLANTPWLKALDPATIAALPKSIALPAPAGAGRDTETLAEAGRRAAEAQHAHERLVELVETSDSETLDQLAPRDVRSRRAPGRALNLLDYERLALDVPGTRIARARAWAGEHPAWPCLTAAGIVTVVVVPDTTVPQPQPSAGLLQAVRAYLDRRRLVGTRVEVVGPTYLEVSVRARVKRRSFMDAVRVAEDVRAALDRFLDPRIGGPAGRGWPFGRDVYRSEVLQVIDGVEGVDHVGDLVLITSSGPPSCGNVSLCPAWLVSPAPHEIRVE